MLGGINLIAQEFRVQRWAGLYKNFFAGTRFAIIIKMK
jgi:hypothetical protein